MADLKQKSKEINDYLNSLKSNLEKEYAENLRIYEEIQQRLLSAKDEGDLSENAAYDQAVKDVGSMSVKLASLQSQLSGLQIISKRREYIPIGIIIPYSTFRVTENKDVVYEGMLVPVEVVDELDLGIYPIDSRVGKAVNKKEVGDIIEMPHIITNVIHRYKIEEIY